MVGTYGVEAAVEEFRTSEEAYCRDLAILVEEYMEPMLADGVIGAPEVCPWLVSRLDRGWVCRVGLMAGVVYPVLIESVLNSPLTFRPIANHRAPDLHRPACGSTRRCLAT